MNIGQRIKQLREQQNMSVSALAKLAGISQPNLWRIENEGQQPTFDILERIINALGMTLSDFFKDNSPSLEPDLRRLLQAAEKLTPEQRELLQRFLDAILDEKGVGRE
ncbi:helix-turn-helix domain-containing protein [Hydrogenispora ethanolica]|jgi:transcriptional regulator with XRE-family HTH domain|uniref:helix-turn-helix domain-containing protein n=1 Tax=Hydrogenispora ethanolica TaxID=1082276 RepID=UPI001052A4F0|nr:helix-turn-helix transcriptional regulator [Hydrogenispora ethanolica]